MITKFKVELDIEDLISMIKGTGPYYNKFDELKEYGSYSDSYGRWTWRTEELKKLSFFELLGIYTICKESWNGDK